MSARRRRTRRGAFAAHLLRNPAWILGAVVTLLILFVAVAAPVVSPYNPIDPHYTDLFHPPSARYLMGTDNFGRDVFSRVLWGARTSATVSFLGVMIGATVGAAWGLGSGYLGSMFDLLSQRVIDALLAFPVLILTMTVVAAFGASDVSLIAAIAVALIPQSARAVRATAIAVREREFVDAARSTGAGTARILLRHILPSCLTPYIVVMSVSLGWAIVVEASLSFLGLGPPPPTPSWGAMLSNEGRQYLLQAPWLALAPGITITVAVFGLSLFGEAISDALDPRLQRSRTAIPGPQV